MAVVPSKRGRIVARFRYVCHWICHDELIQSHRTPWNAMEIRCFRDKAEMEEQIRASLQGTQSFKGLMRYDVIGCDRGIRESATVCGKYAKGFVSIFFCFLRPSYLNTPHCCVLLPRTRHLRADWMELYDDSGHKHRARA